MAKHLSICHKAPTKSGFVNGHWSRYICSVCKESCVAERIEGRRK